MSENGKNIRQYTATDIQQYLEGKLSPAEMHELEKAALHDPFLADALEGMETGLRQKSREGIEADLKELEGRLLQRIEKQDKKAGLFRLPPWARIAAALLIISGGILLTNRFLIRTETPTRPIAQKGEKTQAAVSDSLVPKENAMNPATEEQKEKSAAIPPSPVKSSSEKKEELPKSAPAQAREAETLPDAHATLKAAPPATRTPEAQKKAEFDSAAPAIGNAQPKAVAGIVNTENNRIMQGRVLGSDSKPVAGASITFKNNKRGTVTDNNGEFRLPVGKQDSAVNVVVSSVGYEPQTILLNPTSTPGNIILLKPVNSGLNEVVVSNYRAKQLAESERKEALNDQKLSGDQAVPVGGWEDYLVYLKANKKIGGPDSLLRGREKISFSVDQEGRLSSWHIKQSISPAHDAEAIRLIKEGPPWKLLKGKKEKVTLSLVF